MKIAVLGGGNGGYAAVADFVEAGHEVRWWRRNQTAFDALKKNGLTLTDFRGTRAIDLPNMTTTIASAVVDAELIVIPLPANAQSDLAHELAPHLADGQVVFLPPGTFGSYVLAQALHRCGNPAKVCFAETGTLPHLVRKQDETTVRISGRATRLPTGVFPADRREHAYGVLKQAYNSIEADQNILSAALMNAGPIIHTPLIIMNAGALEHFDQWDIHNAGTQPSVRKVADKLDRERISIRQALGHPAPHFPLSDHYAHTGDEWMYGRSSHEKLHESGDWCEDIDLLAHRYMREDVEYGLSFLVSVANWANVPTPVASGLLAISSAVVGIDFATAGRTLQNLKLSDLTPSELAEHLQHGFT